MLPILTGLLLVAHSAFAAPSVTANVISVFDNPDYIQDSGRYVNGYLVDGPSAYLDAADIPLYVTMLFDSLKDMSNSVSAEAQAGAVINTIVTIGELVSGIPGDACENAAVINAYAYSLSTGDKSGLKPVLDRFSARLSSYIDLIVQLIANPRSVKFNIGPRSNCLGGGRSYQFEQAWDGILNAANPYQIGLLNEVYCAARRLYNAYSISSNNVAAAVTAASIPVVNQLAQNTLSTLVPFLRAVASGSNPAQAAAAAKSGFSQAVANAYA